MNDLEGETTGVGGVDVATLVELYSIHSHLISVNESKRQLANQIYMAIVSAIIAAGAVVVADESLENDVAVDLFAVTVLLLCVVWFLTIQYHRRLSSAKFAVVLKIEKSFPVQPFAEEWKYFKSREAKPWSPELTAIERIVPLIVGLLSLLVLIDRNYHWISAIGKGS